MSRSPDFILKAMDKITDARSGKLGCAWLNEDQSLTIALDPGVSISYNANLVIKLFPNDLESVKEAVKEPRIKKIAKEPEPIEPRTTWVGGLPATFFKGSKP
jgi:hypothetical protein